MPTWLPSPSRHSRLREHGWHILRGIGVLLMFQSGLCSWQTFSALRQGHGPHLANLSSGATTTWTELWGCINIFLRSLCNMLCSPFLEEIAGGGTVVWVGFELLH